MAITKPRNHLEADSRFRRWGKLLTSPDHLDLRQNGGYSLTGPWVGYDAAVPLGPGEYLVVGGETGSRKNHDYSYVLVAGGTDKATKVDWSMIDEVLVAARQAGRITEAQDAASLNHPLYAFALYASVMWQEPVVDRAPLVEEARRALTRLTRAERNALFAELGRPEAGYHALLGQSVHGHLHPNTALDGFSGPPRDP